jgi:hypothetical protein
MKFWMWDMKVKIVLKANYLDVQGEVACGRNGCLANWLNGLWMDWLIWKKCMCELALWW